MGFLGRVAGSAVTGWLRESSPDKVYWLVECALSGKLDISGVHCVYSVISLASHSRVPSGNRQMDGPFHRVGHGRARDYDYDGNVVMFYVHGVLANEFDARKLLSAVPLYGGSGVSLCDPVRLDPDWEKSDVERERLALLRQYRSVLTEWAESVGWGELGSVISEEFEDIDFRDAYIANQ
jgi:hypothetical protein